MHNNISTTTNDKKLFLEMIFSKALKFKYKNIKPDWTFKFES